MSRFETTEKNNVREGCKAYNNIRPYNTDYLEIDKEIIEAFPCKICGKTRLTIIKKRYGGEASALLLKVYTALESGLCGSCDNNHYYEGICVK